MELKDIQELVKLVSKTGVSGLEIETEEIKLTIKNDNSNAQPVVYQQPQVIAAPAPQVVQQAAPAPVSSAPAQKEAAPADNGNYITVKSPMIGTFYRSAGPDKPTFVSVGDEVAPGKVVCIIEAMKLFNEIECEVSGRIVKVLAEDSSPVEYDQPLFLVEPI
jgi:acetyl-CoA carboxylase biotin carboxyl carrier protein